MKKNNKGFFLAETIVIIALITTVMAFVYPNVAKLYENYKNKAVYYDQTEDIYTLKAIYDYLLERGKIDTVTNYGCEEFDNISMLEIEDENIFIGNLINLYITGYITTPKQVINEENEIVNDNIRENDYEFNRYLSRIKKTTYDTTSYRLIGVFENDEGENKKIKYASIKIDNPNPSRNCNLRGEL